MSNVRLWGGPLHGKVVAVQPGQTCLKITSADPQAHPRLETAYPGNPVPVRLSHYSSVAGHRDTDFEWDGYTD